MAWEEKTRLSLNSDQLSAVLLSHVGISVTFTRRPFCVAHLVEKPLEPGLHHGLPPAQVCQGCQFLQGCKLRLFLTFLNGLEG